MEQADAKNGVPMPAQERARKRRTFTLQFKRDVAAQCLEPGASVSGIALSHGINANVVRKWLPKVRAATSTAVATMLPVSVQPAGVVVNPRPRCTATPHTGPRPPIELILQDATVRLPSGFDPSELRSIVQILAALR
jgi:transposase-like protein